MFHSNLIASRSRKPNGETEWVWLQLQDTATNSCAGIQFQCPGCPSFTKLISGCFSQIRWRRSSRRGFESSNILKILDKILTLSNISCTSTSSASHEVVVLSLMALEMDLLMNLFQANGLCRSPRVRSWHSARCSTEQTSRRGSNFSTSSGVPQNFDSASLPPRGIFLVNSLPLLKTRGHNLLEVIN